MRYFLLLVVLAISSIGQAQPPAPQPTDSEGRTVGLADYKGRKNVFLVFNRGFA